MAENYFLVKRRARARKAAYNIYTRFSRKKVLQERNEGEYARDTSRLELQGSKDVGTCRDLQSRNYGYTIGNDTARTTRAPLGAHYICGAGRVPHETARYTIGVNSSANYRRHDDGTGNTCGDQLPFSRWCEISFLTWTGIPAADIHRLITAISITLDLNGAFPF